MRTFAKLILRDLKRGFTYDHSCKRIKMSKKLAIRRFVYLKALCVKHNGNEEKCDRAYERDVAPIVMRLQGKKIVKPGKKTSKKKKAKAVAVAKGR
jgi:hypothetical protein